MKKYLSPLLAIAVSAALSGCAASVTGMSANAATETAVALSQTKRSETTVTATTTKPAVTTAKTKQSETSAASAKKEQNKKLKTPGPIVKLPVKEEQVINETPATYQSLGISKHEKDAFKSKASKNVKLPIINVTTKKNEDIFSLEKYVSCIVDVFNCDEAQIIDEASAGIKVRGNSSAYYGDVEKILKNTVPYRIKFDSKTNMLGLNDGAKCKSWVLLKSDWDLIRNDIALRFGRAIIGDDAFCSDAQFVYLYVNDIFQGIYVLCEQSQVNSNRVNITEPEKGYTGVDTGYYLEIDNYAYSEADNHFFIVDYGKYTVKDIEGITRQFVPAEYSIKSDVYSQNQMDFIKKYLNNLFEIVYRACEKGEYLTFNENYDLVKSKFTNAEDTINAVMDVQSVVDMYLLYEIVHDYDCGEGSFYMCVDLSENSKCPKLQFTSPWDFNWAYNDSTSRYWAAAFCEQSFLDQYGDRSNPWFIVLMKQDWFADMAKQKWTKLHNDGIIQGCIDEEIAILEEYKNDLNKTDKWSTENSYKLLEWISDRIEWMDKTFVK